MTLIMKSAFLASLSRLSTDFTICCSKEDGEKGGVTGCPSKPRGVRWIQHLDTGLIQFEHIQAENEIISRLILTLVEKAVLQRFVANWERKVPKQTQLMEMM